MQLRIDADNENNESLLCEIDGRLDALGAATLVSGAKEQLGKNGKKNLLLDMSKITMLASAGISALVQLYEQTKLLEGQLIIHNPRPQARSVFKVVQLERVISIEDSIEAARIALTSGSDEAVG